MPRAPGERVFWRSESIESKGPHSALKGAQDNSMFHLDVPDWGEAPKSKAAALSVSAQSKPVRQLNHGVALP